MSLRRPALGLLAAALAALAGPALGQPPAGARDRVTFIDAKEGKSVSLDTEVKKESAAGIEIADGKGVRLIPPAEIVRVDYGGLPGVTRTDVNTAQQLEESGDLPKARAKYADLLKAAGANSKAKRYLSFREAMVAVKQADGRTKPEEFQAEAPRAVRSLTDFLQLPDRAWETWPAARTAARLQTELGQADAAAATLASLAKTPGLSAELRYEAILAEATLRLRGKGAAAAKQSLSELERDGKFPASGPLRDRLKVLKAAAGMPAPARGTKPSEAVAAVERAVADASDPTARAVGYNFAGDLYLAAGFPRDAMWQYLWVDTVYPGDADERVHAVRRLAEVFDAQGDAERAAQFREKLPEARQ